MEKKLYVTYEQFGAVGDGKTDDHDAIIAAHAYANEHRLPEKITLKNVRTTSEKPIRFFEDERLFLGVKVNITD